jgi:hypothetical protein
MKRLIVLFSLFIFLAGCTVTATSVGKQDPLADEKLQQVIRGHEDAMRQLLEKITANETRLKGIEVKQKKPKKKLKE